MLADDLVFDDVYAAAEIVGGFEDGSARIFSREAAIVLPVEVAVVAVAVVIGELQQAFLADRKMGDRVGAGDGGLGMADLDGGIETGLSTGQGLKEVGPEGALVVFGLARELWE